MAKLSLLLGEGLSWLRAERRSRLTIRKREDLLESNKNKARTAVAANERLSKEEVVSVSKLRF